MQADRRGQGQRPKQLTELDLRALLEALEEHDVRFVAIGGIAVAAHGYVRATEDLDLVPDPSRDNIDRLVTSLVSLVATLPTQAGRGFDPGRDADALRRGANLTADTRHGGLDVVQRARGIPAYAALEADAVESDVLGIAVRICSLARLREMKRAQGRAQDHADLENLPDG